MGKIDTKIHEDDRRMLLEYIQDFPVRTSKAIFIKKDCVVGNHYHNLKDEIFFLLKGEGKYILDGEERFFNEGDCILVKKGTHHRFEMKEGSIIIESSTLPYDKKDEIARV